MNSPKRSWTYRPADQAVVDSQTGQIVATVTDPEIGCQISALPQLIDALRTVCGAFGTWCKAQDLPYSARVLKIASSALAACRPHSDRRAA